MSASLLLALALTANPTPPDVSYAVRDLGADDYVTREKATRLLWAVGPPAEAALRTALQSNDAEVVARARRLLDLISAGVRPDDPRDLIRAAAEARADLGNWPQHVNVLLDFGPRGLEVAGAILDRHTGQKAALRRTLDAASFRLAPSLIVAGRDGDAEATLQRAARAAEGDEDAPRHYGAFLASRGWLNERWPRWRDAFQRDGKSAALTVALARLVGDHAVARAAAERLDNEEITEAVLFDAGAWAELADLTPTTIQATSYTAVRLGLRANYLRLAGDNAKTDAALDELRTLPVVALRLPAPPFAFQSLMYNRRPADALAALAKLGTPAALPVHFEVLMQQHRDRDAQALLDVLPDTRTAVRWHLDAARLRAAHQRGDTERMDTIVKAATPDGVQLARIEASEIDGLADFVETLVSLDRETDALQFAGALLAAPNTDQKKWAERFEKVSPKTPLAWEAWWTLLGLENPGAPARDTVVRIPALCDARLREPAGRAQLATAEAVAKTDERLLRGLGEACHAAGLDDDAVRLYTAAAKSGSAGWLKLGDLHAERSRWPAAADAYEAGAKADPKAALPLWLAGWARTKAGRDGGAELMARAHVLPLADDKERIKMADELVKRSYLGPEPGDAARRERRLVLRLAKPGSSEARAAQSQLSNDPLAFADRREAAAATDRFLLRMLRALSYFKMPTAYINVLIRRDVQRAAGLLAAGDLDGAVAATEAAQELLPANPAPAAVVVVELAKRGRGADADRLYATAATALDKAVADHPRSAIYAANRAWLAARSRRDLDAALRLAQKATALSPKDASAWEALAEVRLQRGETADAQTAAKRCVELSPRSAYYPLFAARAATGDKDAPLPEGVLR